MVLPVLVGVLLVLTLFAGGPAPADAGGVTIIVGGGHHQRLRHGHHVPPHAHVFVVPRTIFVVPSLPPCRWVPGYWTYRWIPQSYAYDVWVPGHWSPDGTWIQGHYAPHTVSTGYHQPVWVEARCIQG